MPLSKTKKPRDKKPNEYTIKITLNENLYRIMKQLYQERSKHEPDPNLFLETILPSMAISFIGDEAIDRMNKNNPTYLMSEIYLLQRRLARLEKDQSQVESDEDIKQKYGL